MKQYLLTEDQIERMLACAIEQVALLATNHTPRPIEEILEHPIKRTHEEGIRLFKRIKETEIIEPINQN